MSSSLSLSLSPLSPSPSLLNDLDFLVLRVFSKTCEFECFTGNEYAYRSELESLHTYIHRLSSTRTRTHLGSEMGKFYVGQILLKFGQSNSQHIKGESKVVQVPLIATTCEK